MRIVICWTEIAGYTAACWRALASRAEVDLHILAWPSNFTRTGSQYERSLVQGLPIRLLEDHEQQDCDLVARLAAEKNPDIVLMGGWNQRPYRQLVTDDRLASARMILAMDTPWRGDLRQRFARLKIGRYIDRLDAIFVPGLRGQQFARHLKMPEDRIFTGMLGFDFDLYQNVLEQRAAASLLQNPPPVLRGKRAVVSTTVRERAGRGLFEWPRSFVFMGRYSVEKSLDTLAAAYSEYRKKTPDPFSLHCYGSGPFRHQLENVEGLHVHDWVHPADQPAILAQHGVGILTSHREAWSLAVAEQMASGLPMICTDAVGAVPDLILPEKTGLICCPNSPRDIAEAMRWMHDHHDNLPAMGQAARDQARPYSASNWAQRVIDMCNTLHAGSFAPRRRPGSLPPTNPQSAIHNPK